MGKRMIYGPKGAKVVINDGDEIPDGWGVDPALIGKKPAPEPQGNTVNHKLMTDKDELEEFGRSIGIEVDKRKSVQNIIKDIDNGLQA